MITTKRKLVKYVAFVAMKHDGSCTSIGTGLGWESRTVLRKRNIREQKKQKLQTKLRLVVVQKLLKKQERLLKTPERLAKQKGRLQTQPGSLQKKQGRLKNN